MSEMKYARNENGILKAEQQLASTLQTTIQHVEKDRLRRFVGDIACQKHA